MIKININKRLNDLKTKQPSSWEKLGEKQVIKLANFVIQNVPAYQQFLKENKIKIKTINSLNQFQKLPILNKNNYLRKYHYQDLFPKNYFSKITTIAATSGSTGEPFYFPRGEEQDEQYQYVAELFLKNQFNIDNKQTLAIVGFGLGIWIGGIFTYKNFNQLSQKGYRITLAPAGTNKQIFLETFKKMAPYFDQIILMGYPPFIKDVIDEAPDFGINWQDYHLKIITAAEGFSEKFRDYLAKKTNIKNQLTDIINIYGTVELGTMAHETALSVLIRKLLVNNSQAYQDIFSDARRLPTLAQYHPYLDYFEEIDNEVVGSGYGSAIPLLRYQFFDKGGVIPFGTMVSRLKTLGIDIYSEARKTKIEKDLLKLPFVYVYERSDFVVVLRGANIFPENVKNSLQNDDLDDLVTGKFTMVKKESKKLEEYLEIHIELKKRVKETAKILVEVKNHILRTLLKDNSEFSYLYNTESTKVTPKIILHPYEDLEYFRPGSKQKWVKKS